jgi:hypothetical protein
MLIKKLKRTKINNMKTLRNIVTGELKRVNDKEAEKLVRQKFLNWMYTSKETWKKENSKKKVVVEETTSETPKKSTKKGN